jgi:hypothetical protein
MSTVSIDLTVTRIHAPWVINQREAALNISDGFWENTLKLKIFLLGTVAEEDNARGSSVGLLCVTLPRIPSASSSIAQIRIPCVLFWFIVKVIDHTDRLVINVEAGTVSIRAIILLPRFVVQSHRN